jgi:hypothetical protein
MHFGLEFSEEVQCLARVFAISANRYMLDLFEDKGPMA